MRHPSKIYMETFGCQMNKLDSELLLDRMISKGYEITEDSTEAGVIVFNTCSVREHAEDRVYSYLGRLKKEKEKNPHLVIAVIGCMAQLHQNRIHKKMPHVDIVLGTSQFLELPRLVEEARGNREFFGEYGLAEVTPPKRGGYLSSKHSAFLSVIRGCDMPCTFCVVPKTRGPMVSKPLDLVIDEAKSLVDKGVVEITLLGQTVDGYGKDTHRKLLLPQLLEELNKIEGLRRIRYITSHPSFITRELVEATVYLEKVCEYLHMPAQSGSDRMLKKMKRGYNRRIYLEKVGMIREIMEEMPIASDFIVGFPGEDERDFQDSVSLIEEARFQNSFIFKYSPRPYTAASEMEDKISEEIKKKRNHRLLEVQGRVSQEWKNNFLGRQVEILVDGPSKKDPNMISGRTRGNDIVVFPKPEKDCPKAGDFVEVKLEKANSFTFYGSLVFSAEKYTF